MFININPALKFWREEALRDLSCMLKTDIFSPKSLRRPLLETAYLYSTISADGAFAPDDMLPATSDLDVVDMESGHSRRLLGGVYPEGDHSSDILITSNEHAPREMLPNFVSKRKLAQAGFEDLDQLPEPGPVYCGDGVCGGEPACRLSVPMSNNTNTPAHIPI